jgi:hypothetical protein
VVLNFLTDAEEDVFPMIPGGKTIHEMVLDSSGKAVPVGGHSNGNGNGSPSVNGVPVDLGYNTEWNDDLEAGKIKA